MSKDIFCKLMPIWKENNQIFVENETSIGILSIEPFFVGQGLLIPKNHCESLGEVKGLDNYLTLSETFHEEVLRQYNNDESYFENFYKKLYENPPTENSKRLALELLKGYQLYEKPSGFNIGFNFGESAGQTVNHVHMHYIPRRNSDKTNLGVGTAFRNLLK